MLPEEVCRPPCERPSVTDATNADVGADSRLLDGEPAPAIVGLALRVAAALLVMSTHGRSGLGRWVYGSVAERVLRASVAPVLLVPALARTNWEETDRCRIVVPLDGSPLAETVLT